jgi:hypothetical protein
VGGLSAKHRLPDHSSGSVRIGKMECHHLVIANERPECRADPTDAPLEGLR